jgi:serine/threonine protein kinase
MEYASQGQLYSIIKKHKKLCQIIAKQYMKEIISAIQYLHTRSPPIIHRDIKPENILIDQEGNCKLADFGWANFDNGRKNIDTFGGTPEYLAPEMINQCGHDKSVDIWALGILLFEMLTGRIPFNFSENKTQLYNSIKILKINWTDDFPHLAKDLISKILCINPNERLSLEEILNHQWFRETPSLRPFLNDLVSNDNQKKVLELNIIKSHSNFIKNNNNKNNNLSKRELYIKIIRNDENSFKETNISHELNQKNNNIINERYY